MATAPLKHNPYSTKPREHRARGSAWKRGYNKEWQRFRELILAEQPLCVECLKADKLVKATDVDHIRAVIGPDDPLFYAKGNHQSLCHACHSRKTDKEDGGFGRVKKRNAPQANATVLERSI